MASSKKSAAKQQVELWIELKENVDLVYRQLNQYRGACRSVDKLNRAVTRTGGQLDPARMLVEFVKFERDYRVSRKRLRKLDRKLLAVNLYDKLYDLYESFVMEESIGTGGDLIDSSAIDKAIVVDCNGPVGIEDASVDDFAGISIDPDTPIDVEMDLMEDACLEPRQSATLNHSLNKSSTDLSQSSSILFTDISASTRVTRQQTRRMACINSSAIVVGCNGQVGIEDTPVDGIVGTERHFKCPQCDKSFRTSSNLSSHKRTHESEPRFKCSWEGCDFGAYYSQALKDHQTVHTGERSFQCSHCGKSFKNSSVLIRHKRTHEFVHRFKCSSEGCDYGTHRNDKLKAHQTFHTGKYRFKCNWEGCDYGTYYFHSLKDHSTVHSDERPFQCSQCDKSFKTSSALSSHKRTHEIESRFKCSWEGCDYGANFNELFKAHQTLHTGKHRFKCSWEGCDFGTHRIQHFKAHQTVHTGKHRFKCSWEGCGYGTNYSHSLKDHQTVHTGERPFQCPQCDKSFKYSSDLSHHKRSHESELRFKCNWEGCDYGSHQLVNLTRHQNRHMKPKLKA